MTSKVVNRRIRLLFVLLALALAGSLARAVWLQGVRAQPLSNLAAKQQRQTLELPARRGTIFDRNGVPLALGEQATTVYADPTQIQNARLVALAAEKALGLDAETIFPQLKDTSSSFVYLKRKADSAKAERSAKAQAPRRRLLHGGAPPVSARRRRRAGARVRRSGQPGARRDRAPTGRRAAGPARAGDGDPRPVRPRGRRAERDGRAAGSRRLPDARPPHPGEGRRRAAEDRAPVGREVGDRRRARPELGRDLRDGDRADVRREPLRGSEPGRAAQPHRERHLRARFDVQVDPGRRRALRRARDAALGVHAPDVDSRCRPRDPRARSAADGADDGRGHRRAIVERRRDHARADGSARSGSRPGSTASASGARPASTFRARRPGSFRRWSVGPARRSARSRSATGSR